MSFVPTIIINQVSVVEPVVRIIGTVDCWYFLYLPTIKCDPLNYFYRKPLELHWIALVALLNH